MRALKIFLPIATAIIFAGCASYHLGPVMDKDENHSVEVLPFNNQTLEPRLGDAFTQALRERLQVDATYHLDTHGDGDIVVSGVVRDYKRSGLGYSGTDSITPQNYRLEVTVHIIARERSTGKALLDRDVKGHTLVNVGQDLASAERQALPLLGEDLARNITELLAEGTW
jgi:Lipopolysaccharide-assembly